MREEIASTITPEQLANPSTYQVVETTGDIVRAMQSSIAVDIEDVAVVKVTLHFTCSEDAQKHRREQATQSTLYFLHTLRTLVRKTDSVFLLRHAFYIVLPGANDHGGSIVEERLWDALLWRIHNTHELHEVNVLLPQRVTIGCAASSWPCDDSLPMLHGADKIRRSFTLQHETPAHQTSEQSTELHAQPFEDSELRFQARELGIPYLTFLPRKSVTKVRRLLNPKLAQELHCYPLGRDRDILTVAMSNPQDHDALDRLQQETGLHIFPVLAPPRELQTALEQLV